MTSAVLTSLCNTCRNAPPKYKCPGCGARTCSVPCIQKHKSWALCSGQRNPAAYMSSVQLRTPAGIDHDYNFLTSIERACERAEKCLVEERGLVTKPPPQMSCRPGPHGDGFDRVWYGDELHHLPHVASGRHDRDAFDKQVRRCLRARDIHVVSAPAGMSRQKENKTSYNRRSGLINWQVEWLIFLDNLTSAGLLGSSAGESLAARRLLHKTLDSTLLYQAMAQALEEDSRQRKRKRDNKDDGDEDNNGGGHPDHPKTTSRPRKTRNQGRKHARGALAGVQYPHTTTWATSPFTMQHPTAGSWSSICTTAALTETSKDNNNVASTKSLRYFLLHTAPQTSTTTIARATQSRRVKSLIPCSPSDSLADILTGRSVAEFPTIYVLPAMGSLPIQHELASAEQQARRRTTLWQPPWRQGWHEEEEDDEDEVNNSHTNDFDRSHRNKRTKSFPACRTHHDRYHNNNNNNINRPRNRHHLPRRYTPHQGPTTSPEMATLANTRGADGATRRSTRDNGSDGDDGRDNDTDSPSDNGRDNTTGTDSPSDSNSASDHGHGHGMSDADVLADPNADHIGSRALPAAEGEEARGVEDDDDRSASAQRGGRELRLVDYGSSSESE